MIDLAYTLPTGKIGQQLAVAASGLTARALQRPAFDWTKPETYAPQLRDVRVLFANPMPMESQPENERALYAAAKDAGVQHIIKLSVVRADHREHTFARLHAGGEEALRASGVPYTILRPTFFMQNALGLADPIRGGVFPAAMADKRIGQIDTRDIADAVVAIARAPQHHAGNAYTLTSQETFDGNAFAEAFSAATHRTVNYIDVPEDGFRASLLSAGLDAWYAEGLVDLYRFVRSGHADVVTSDLQQLLARAPRTFETFIQDHASAFAG